MNLMSSEIPIQLYDIKKLLTVMMQHATIQSTIDNRL